MIEWYQVQHFPQGEPETFEIILDWITNRDQDPVPDRQLIHRKLSLGWRIRPALKRPYMPMDDPGLVDNNTAVEFYPVFGAPPPSGGSGEMLGTVTDRDTALPIEGALVTAEALTFGETFTYTTDMYGTYSASLCADWYDVKAEASGYVPSAEVRTSVYSGTQTIQDFALLPIVYPPNVVTLSGPGEGSVNTPYTFTATVEPVSTTLPLTFVWESNGQVPITHTGGLTDTVDFTWEFPGTQVITVTASNLVGEVSANHIITITTPIYQTYLPLMIKPAEPPFGSVPAPSSLDRGLQLGLLTIGIVGWRKRRG